MVRRFRSAIQPGERGQLPSRGVLVELRVGVKAVLVARDTCQAGVRGIDRACVGVRPDRMAGLVPGQTTARVHVKGEGHIVELHPVQHSFQREGRKKMQRELLHSHVVHRELWEHFGGPAASSIVPIVAKPTGRGRLDVVVVGR